MEVSMEFNANNIKVKMMYDSEKLTYVQKRMIVRTRQYEHEVRNINAEMEAERRFGA
jgi:hypothetical protein